MDWPYRYTPYIWPMLATAVSALALGMYAWRRRSVPGALPLSIAFLFGALWAVSAALEIAAIDVPTKIFWNKFVVAVCTMPTAVARFCFVLEYAGLARWLSRRNLALLAIPIILELFLVLTNDWHHWFTLSYEFDGTVRPQLGVGGQLMTVFVYLLLVVNLIILVRLFFRSPQHRWPVALILCAMLTTHTVFLLDIAYLNPFAPLNPTVLSMNISLILYSLALFRFHMFDPIPASRKTVIEQMREGMLVVDASGKIVDLNPTVESILDLPATRVRGRDASEILPACGGLSAEKTQAEISLMTNRGLRHYELSLSPLMDRGGVLLGHLLLLHDVTEQKQAQAQLLEQQRAMATLQERERLARELHDNAGQMLGYVSMQAQAIRKWVQDGETAVAETQLTCLANAAKEAHIDLRESIFNLKTGPSEHWSFQIALNQHLAAFGDNYGIRTEMNIPEWLGEDSFLPGTSVQLLRVIQEAMSNARRHGHARCVRVTFERQDSQARILITDDGCGFDPDQINQGAGDHFGLAFMAERMEQIGGQMRIISQPGAGTQVLLQVPLQDEREERE